MNNKFTEDMLAAFNKKDLNTMLTVLKHCEKVGVSTNELKEYLQGLKNDRLKYRLKQKRDYREVTEKSRAMWISKAPKCPLCGDPLNLRSLTSCTKANPGQSKSHWFCDSHEDSTCLYEKYSMKTYEEEMKAIGSTTVS